MSAPGVPPAKRPTILDVARLAGVSHQTVSRYLRFSGEGLKPQTVARVSAAVDELGYRPNLVARSMRTRRTGRLAVLIPTVAFNPARMLAGASAVAHEAGYAVDVISVEGGAASRSARLSDLVEFGQVEGVLSFAPLDTEAVERMPAATTVVIAAELDDEMRGIGELADGSAMTEIIERLAASGHRRFFHVAGARDFASARARREIYLATVERLGLESVGIYDGDWSGESGVAAVATLPDDAPPLAILAANDLVAAGVLAAVTARGWRVPAEVSVTGWDDVATAPFLIPALTSVAIDLERIGSDAMRRLLAAMRGEEAELHDGPTSRVVWRASTGSPEAPPT
ncbi:LacI family DNA-binding transcriptional regulator [Microbacterium radiodurans]|uniref:LacI family transcriptional regulator n=1 Tax=Microbacterium radiodurans TaxID=661398 RepID=A0A5J5IT31_9MICO|nr:LacI family DNA-binding transcriptional regulator [Microbacterium radiodurans]KAA9089183.1 LacI family transcriptional regulator [Microbacterium radiodurans]